MVMMLAPLAVRGTILTVLLATQARRSLGRLHPGLNAQLGHQLTSVCRGFFGRVESPLDSRLRLDHMLTLIHEMSYLRHGMGIAAVGFWFGVSQPHPEPTKLETPLGNTATALSLPLGDLQRFG
jgi:hypothetical protein